jgi:hypothetical protein
VRRDRGGRRGRPARPDRARPHPDDRGGRRQCARTGASGPRAAGTAEGTARARAARRGRGGGRGRPAHVPESARRFPGRPAPPRPAWRHRRLGRRRRTRRPHQPPGQHAAGRSRGPGRRASRRAGDTAGLRRVRAAEPLRGAADRGGGGDGLRDPGRGHRRERRVRHRGSRRDRAAGTAAAPGPDGRRRALPAGSADRRDAHGGYRPGQARRPVRGGCAAGRADSRLCAVTAERSRAEDELERMRAERRVLR